MNQVVLKGKSIQSVFLNEDDIFKVEIMLEVESKALLCVINNKELGKYYLRNYEKSEFICIYGHLDSTFLTINCETTYKMFVVADEIIFIESSRM